MKITVTKSIDEEIELPKFFKSGEDRFFMILPDEKTALYLKDMDETHAVLEIYPSIERVKIDTYSSFLNKYGFEEILESQFRQAFNRLTMNFIRLMDL